MIMLTLSPDAARLDEMFDAGASAAVSKATHPAALATLIRETLEGRVLHFYTAPGQAAGARRHCGDAGGLRALRT